MFSNQKMSAHECFFCFIIAKYNLLVKNGGHARVTSTKIESLTNFNRSSKVLLIYSVIKSAIHRWGCESTDAPLENDRKTRSVCLYGRMQAGGRVARLRSHLITGDPYKSSHKAPLTNTQAHNVITTHTLAYSL